MRDYDSTEKSDHRSPSIYVRDIQTILRKFPFLAKSYILR